MTGSICTASAKSGGKFTAWDGYISGRNLDLLTNRRILQSWRTSDFQSYELDSFLLVRLEEVKGGSKVTIIHAEIPSRLGNSLKHGWIDYYLLPMKIYFK
jgi:activator of HSP90 ATPase